MKRIILTTLITSGGSIPSPAEGTVLSVELDNINGFFGNVLNPTVSPLIQIKFTVEGLVISNSSGVATGLLPTEVSVLSGTALGAINFVNTLPAVNSGSTLGTNPVTSLLDTLNNIFADLKTHAEDQGTVTDVLGANTNGFIFNIATSTTTPNITLSTSVTGIIKGAGNALVQAIAGTDYVIPSGTVANATNAVNAVNAVNADDATNAANLLVTAVTDSNPYSLALVDGANTQTKPFFVASGLTYTPSTSTLTGTFNGPLTGTASSATKANNLSGTGSNAVLVQTANNVTTRLPAAQGLLYFNSGTSTLGYVTTLASTITIGSGLATSPFTSSPDSLNDILQALKDGGTGTGTVTSFGFTNANSFIGHVANDSTTPNLTLYSTGISAYINSTRVTYQPGNIIRGDGTNGALGSLYVCNTTTTGVYVPSSWTLFSADSAGVTTIGTINSAPKSANGAVISGRNIFFQTADTTYPGLISAAAQTITGTKVIQNSSTTSVNSLAVYNPDTTNGNSQSISLQTQTTSTGAAANVNATLLTSTVTDHANATLTANTSWQTYIGGTLKTVWGFSSTGVTTAANISSSAGDMLLSSTNAYYLGAATTDGSWRYRVSSGNIVWEKRISGSWVNQFTIPFSGGQGGVNPYSSALTYNKGEYISGDGTNGLLGGIYVCLTNGTTGTFSISDWAIENGLDLTNFNSYSSTFTLANATTGQYNSFGAYNAGTAPSISGDFNVGFGPFCITSGTEISGQKNALFGGATANGNFSTASFNSGFGFGSGSSLSTGNYNLFGGYLSGSDVDVGNANILFGALGSSGSSFNNNLIFANPQNNNPIISLSSTNAAYAANQVLATPINATGAFTSRALIPSYTTSARNALSGVSAGTIVLDTTLSKLAFYTGSAWQVVTSAAG